MEGLSAVDLRAAYVNAVIAHPAGFSEESTTNSRVGSERVDVKALRLLLDEELCQWCPRWARW